MGAMVVPGCPRLSRLASTAARRCLSVVSSNPLGGAAANRPECPCARKRDYPDPTTAEHARLAHLARIWDRCVSWPTDTSKYRANRGMPRKAPSVAPNEPARLWVSLVKSPLRARPAQSYICHFGRFARLGSSPCLILSGSRALVTFPDIFVGA